MALGFIIYFAYSRHTSTLAKGQPEAGLEGRPEMLSER
jgi:hypothetical protein